MTKTATIIPFPVQKRFDPSLRGYHPVYRGAGTPCPGCNHTNWYVGRFSAECAFCATAILL